MLFGAIISFLVRNVREDYNQSAGLGMAVSFLFNFFAVFVVLFIFFKFAFLCLLSLLYLI
jgi:hypothetical protein